MLPTYLQKLFMQIKGGVSDEEVASYIFDVFAAVGNIEMIDYQ